jgi:DNA-directed RNA polymerase subunit beta'
MVLGIYYLTKERNGALGEGKTFADTQDVRIAYDAGLLSEHAKIKVRMNGGFVDTTAGRVLFSEIAPSEITFEMINKDMTKKELSKIIEYAFKKAGKRKTVVFLDNLEKLGFHYATNSGISICMADMHIPSRKPHDTPGRTGSHRSPDIRRRTTQGERYNK